MSFGGGFNGGGGGSSYSSGDGNLVADSLYDANGTSIAMAFHHPHINNIYSPSTTSIHHHLPIFNSLPLSLAIKPKMEGFNDMGFINGENFGIEKAKEEEYESRSGSDNMEAGSGDDQDILPADNKSLKRKKYHRHTPYQIQELENSFKENPHPDEKARLDLGRRLKLESKQVKFWFQNRRTQMKTQMERHENNILKQENNKLRIENITVKEAMRNPICGNCGSPAALGDVSLEQHHLRFENARLKDELNRICLLANKFLGKPLLSLPSPIAPTNSNLDLAVGRNGFSLPTGLDFGTVLSLPPAMPMPQTMGMMMMTTNNGSVDKSVYLELGLSAMSELVRLAQVDSLLWFESPNGHGETLNVEEYNREFSGCIGMKPDNFVTEATRASGSVIISSMALIDILMDSNQWAEMFPSLIGRASSNELISDGIGGSKNGALQLMHAEFQVLSPLVPVRQARFLRFCKQHAEGVWVVADVSVDSGGEGAFATCRRLPSGCIVQEMPNGYSKIIWIEHMEYDERDVHEYFKPLVRSGMGFGASRWVAILERQCECLAVMMSSTVPSGDHSVISPSGRRNITSLAQRMTRSFCAGVCSTMYKWEIVQEGSSKDAKLMIRKSIGNPGEPSGVVLSATITVWMPVSHQRLFDFLRNEQTRSQWDVLSQDGLVQQMLHIAKGHDLGNNISLLRASSANGITNCNQGGMLLLQETCTDVSGSMVVHAAVDVPSMNVVMSGGDSSCVALLPSGFAIIPDFVPNPSGPSSNEIRQLEDGSAAAAATDGGCLLTVGFQILVNNLPSAKLTMASVDTVNTLISRTVQAIRSNLQCN